MVLFASKFFSTGNNLLSYLKKIESQSVISMWKISSDIVNQLNPISALFPSASPERLVPRINRNKSSQVHFILIF